MFENTRRTCSALGVATTMTLCTGLAVVAGIIPHAERPATDLRTAAVLPLEVPTVDQTLTTTGPTTTAAPPTTEAPTTTTMPEVTTTAPPTAEPEPSSAPVADIVVPEPTAATEPVAPTEPMASSAVPRRVPSSAEVDQALVGLKPFVQSVFSPGRDQVAEAGDKICTALDEGQTVEQVKAAGLELVRKVPFTTIKPGADDYVMRTSVALYCPDHASKLA